ASNEPRPPEAQRPLGVVEARRAGAILHHDAVDVEAHRDRVVRRDEMVILTVLESARVVVEPDARTVLARAIARMIEPKGVAPEAERVRVLENQPRIARPVVGHPSLDRHRHVPRETKLVADGDEAGTVQANRAVGVAGDGARLLKENPADVRT